MALRLLECSADDKCEINIEKQIHQRTKDGNYTYPLDILARWPDLVCTAKWSIAVELEAMKVRERNDYRGEPSRTNGNYYSIRGHFCTL